MKDYFIADERWELAFGVKSLKDYYERYCFEVKFHKNVPDDIRKGGQIVEELLVYSYYNYELSDEAMKKMLNLFELSVRLKCVNIGIKVESENRNGKNVPVPLGNLISSLEYKSRIGPLVPRFKDIVYLRNHFSHPKEHAFGGLIYREAIKEIIGYINLMFE